MCYESPPFHLHLTLALPSLSPPFLPISILMFFHPISISSRPFFIYTTPLLFFLIFCLQFSLFALSIKSSFVRQNSGNSFGFFRFLLYELLYVCLSVPLCAMCLTLCDVFVLKMNFTVYWEFRRTRNNNTFGRFIASV